MSEAGEPTGARGNRRLSVVRAVHEPTRSESEGEHVCGPDVILTVGEKGAREGARVKIMPVGSPQTAGRASRSGAGLTIFGIILQTMFEVRNIAFTYRKKPVLRDVSFVVSPGEVVCVIGANGAGKTTLLKVLATLAAPDSGVVMVDGQNAFAKPLRYRRQLGYLPERVALYEEMTVKEYLNYRAALKGEPVKRIRRRVDEACEMCKVSEFLRSPIGSLSAGLKKRVALADALLLRPRVLLLDDFLAGLDSDMRETAGAVLSNAAAFSSVIATGHELDDLAKWATRFFILRDGVISASVSAVGVDRSSIRGRIAAALKGSIS